MLSNKHIHIHIPRTGGQRIRSIFFNNKKNFDFLYRDSHKSLQEYINVLKTQYKINKVPFSFTFVRKPWDWYVSRFFFRVQTKLPHQNIKIENFENNKDGFINHMYLLAEYIEKNKTPSTGVRIWNMNNTITDFYNNMTKPKVNFVGKLETFKKDIIYILNQIGVNFKINTSKYNSSHHKKYIEYYNDDLIKLVSKWDAQIIRDFNYKFGD